MRRASARGIAALLLASASVGTGGAEPATGQQPPDQSAGSRTEGHIVVLEAGQDRLSTTSQVSRHAAQADVEPAHVYAHALRGYSADLTPAQVTRLEADPRVAYVERDGALRLQQSQDPQSVPTGVRRTFAPDHPDLGTGDQVDQRVDADIAVIDSGVSYHPDLNVVRRVDCTRGDGCVPGGDDFHGHGSHVAGTAAALDDERGVVGMAPGARIWSLQACVESGLCPTSATVAAIDRVTAHADAIEVANMSLGGGSGSQALADAISASVDAGIVYTVAAGNAGEDASDSQPGNHPDVVTVSALSDADGLPGGTGGEPACRDDQQDDHLATFSNWGSEVEVAAPGVCIRSTWNDGGYSTASGTSMAAPHVAGAAAILTSGDQAPTDRAGALAVRDSLESSGNLNWTWESRGEGDVQEPLLDVADPAVYQPDMYVPAVASFDVVCDDATLTCQVDGSASHHPDAEVTGWSWDFGDGHRATGPTASHTYDRAARYPITLTVTAGDASGTAVQEVVVGDPAWQPAADVPGYAYRFAEAQCPSDPDGYYKIDDRVRRYDVSDDTWADLAEHPDPAMEGSTAVCAEGRIHVMGGWSGNAQAHHVYDIATDTWTTAAALPRPTTLTPVGHWDGKIYLLGGGSSATSPTDQAHVYDIATDTWSEAPPLPRATSLAGHAQVGSSVYLMGGWGPEGPVARTLRFDMATGTWSTGPDLAEPRYEPTVVATDTALYTIGGFPEEAADEAVPYAIATDAVERLEIGPWPNGAWEPFAPYPHRLGFMGSACGPAPGGATIHGMAGGSAASFIPVTSDEQWRATVTGERCAHLDQARWEPAASMPGGRLWSGRARCPGDPGSLYSFGGSRASLGDEVASAWRYDAGDDTWVELAPYPGGARAGLTAACLPGGRIHVMGGLGDGAQDHFVYDVATDSWQAAAPLPRPVAFAALGAWDGQLHLAGGNENGALGPTDAVSVYDVATDSWSSGPEPLPEPVAMAGVAQSGSDLYVVGGFGTDSPQTNVTSTLRLDLTDGTWSSGPAFPSARYGTGLVATDTALYAVGGLADGSYSYDPTAVTERLDLGSWPGGGWTAQAPLPEAAGFLTAWCAPGPDGGSSLAAAGGIDEQLDPVDAHRRTTLVRETCAPA